MYRYIFFFRLTPTYFIILMIYTNLFHYFAEGPFMLDRISDVDNCASEWWRNLLYINNLFEESAEYKSVRTGCCQLFHVYAYMIVHAALSVLVDHDSELLHSWDGLFLQLIILFNIYSVSYGPGTCASIGSCF